MRFRNPNWELSPIFEFAFYIWPGDDGVKLPNLCDGFKGEISRQRRNEHLHLQYGKSPPDA